MRFFFSKPTLGTIRVPCYAQFGSNGHPDATWFEGNDVGYTMAIYLTMWAVKSEVELQSM
jgi:hypothetical protein